jgi:hypothetical protein
MNRRNFIKGTFSSIVFVSTAGCLTPKFNESRFVTGKYLDTVISFLITEDGSKLVVLGEKYHYIFDVSPSLKNVLLGPIRSELRAYFEIFHVTLDNKISGDYSLELLNDATDEQKNAAVDAGFTPGELALTLSGHLEGIRYSAEGFPPIGQAYKFNQQYIVEIQEEQSAANKAGKILATPIVILADGVLILTGVALVLLVIALRCGAGVQ